MRHRGPILFATLGLVFGGALAAAYPAAASTAVSESASRAFGEIVRPGAHAGPMVQPGGPAEHGAAPRPRSAAAGVQQTTVTSSNWAGYAASGGTGAYTSVASSWVQPAARCSFGDQYSAFWVGLDGYSSGTVEQTGSEADCIGRTAQYSAWYEMYPAYPVYFNNTVRAGDHFSGSVSYVSGSQFQVTLTDSTQGWTHTVIQSVPGAARSSAEVITEAPCCTAWGGTLPLTNFGSVNFTGATVNSAGLCASNPVEIVMPNATVSPITACRNFTVTYTAYGGWPWPFF
jgi:hypothetical protein